MNEAGRQEGRPGRLGAPKRCSVLCRGTVRIKKEVERDDIPRDVRRSEDGCVVAECPALPGCVSQGKDQKEALDNIKEAITAWLWAEEQKAMKALPSKPEP